MYCCHSGLLHLNPFPALPQSPGMVSPIRRLREAGPSQLIGPRLRGSLSSWNRRIHLIFPLSSIPTDGSTSVVNRPLRSNLSPSAARVCTDSTDGTNQLLRGFTDACEKCETTDFMWSCRSRFKAFQTCRHFLNIRYRSYSSTWVHLIGALP